MSRCRPASSPRRSGELWSTRVTAPPSSHGYTYSSHPLVAAVALANLDLIARSCWSEASVNGDYLQAQLRAALADHPLVAEVRGRDMIAAVEFVARKDPSTAFDPKLTVAARIVKAALARGVISRALPNADTIAFSPPLIITDSESTCS